MEKRILEHNPEGGILKGFFYKNPVLVRMIGIGPVVGAAVSLKNGIAIAIIMTVMFFATGLFSYALGNRMPLWARTPAYVILSSVVVIPAFLVCSKLMTGVIASIGVFGPIMIVNSIIISRTGKYGEGSLEDTFKDISGNVLGFVFVVLVFSTLREIISYGTIFDIPISTLKYIRAFSKPCLGYIMLGFFAAILKKLRHYVRDKREEIA